MENDSKEDQSTDLEEIWMNDQCDSTSDESYGILELPENGSDFLDLEMSSTNFVGHDSAPRQMTDRTIRKLQKLQVTKLQPISISSSAASPQHIVNLKQSFNFPASFKPAKEISTQTSSIELQKSRDLCSRGSSTWRLVKRPSSLPPQNAALTNLELHEKAKPKTTERGTGDGIQVNCVIKELRNPDMELAECIPPTPVHCVGSKPKLSRKVYTPKFSYRKQLRPPTKFLRRRVPSSTTTSCDPDEPRGALDVKPQNLLHFDKSSDLSTDNSLDSHENIYTKISSIIDKLQDSDWEICTKGLQQFVKFAGGINWESDAGQKFIPIISRKLIDFFKSPRSSLCRTACQTAGDFFVMAKSTKRPEFDEMVDLLLCRSSDPNRFIQKDANLALDKMAISICVNHSVRAVCSKGPDNKNCVVRATTARILFIICKNAGVELIVGSEANTRTRMRVLSNLRKFLMDKNLETRRHAEKLCKMLKRHKFFVEYFFKDIDQNYKSQLRKILNSLDAK